MLRVGHHPVNFRQTLLHLVVLLHPSPRPAKDPELAARALQHGFAEVKKVNRVSASSGQQASECRAVQPRAPSQVLALTVTHQTPMIEAASLMFRWNKGSTSSSLMRSSALPCLTARCLCTGSADGRRGVGSDAGREAALLDALLEQLDPTLWGLDLITAADALGAFSGRWACAESCMWYE